MKFNPSITPARTLERMWETRMETHGREATQDQQQAAKEQFAKDAMDFRMKQRVENAATQIFAAMQANPNWVASKHFQNEAVEMARELIRAIDEQCGADKF